MIRRAEEKDIERLLYILSQVLEVHARIRPDLFVSGTTKYSADELKEIIGDDKRPIFVYVDENDEALGYAFCIVKEPAFTSTMHPRTTMFIDDLCVDEAYRGKKIASSLFDYVKDEAKKLGCYEVTLNVWEGNDSARAFYDKMGMKPKETQLELIL